jgi:hypothetical protein
MLSISGQTVYTTTVTEIFTTVISTLKTELLENTITFTITENVTSLTEVETHKTVLHPTVILSPTQVMVEETYIVTKYVHKPDGSVEPVFEKRVRQVQKNKFATRLVTMPTIITSTKTNTATIKQTVESRIVSITTQSKTEITTMTLEKVYTSTGTSSASTTNQEWIIISDLFYDFFLWILFLVALIVAGAFVFLYRRSRIRSGKAVLQSFCISCGSPIPSGVKHCPECGASQK